MWTHTPDISPCNVPVGVFPHFHCPSIHPFIFQHLSGVGSQRQRHKQGIPSFPFPSHFIQLVQGSRGILKSPERHSLSSVSRRAQGLLLVGLALNTSPGRGNLSVTCKYSVKPCIVHDWRKSHGFISIPATITAQNTQAALGTSY